MQETHKLEGTTPNNQRSNYINQTSSNQEAEKSNHLNQGSNIILPGLNMDISKYSDIIDLPHHVSIKHPRMAMEKRAAQFAPFAALVGYSDVIKYTEHKVESSIDTHILPEDDDINFIC